MQTTLRDGRFVLQGSLGEGAQGRTFDGVDKREGRAVAIKRFDVRGASTWKSVELAEREVRVLSSLSHPKLPAFVDHFEADGALYLVMEKIEGESLAALRKRGGTLEETEVLRLLRDASEVLDYLHTRAPPVIHRDLKPGNVIRRPDGSFAFVDFGAVRDKLRPEGGSTVVGTFGYMAPEQFQGRAIPASDVYSIGATALTMLTGREPEELPHKGLAIDVRAALAGRTSPRLVSALERMLDPDPDHRAERIAPLLEGRRSTRPREDWQSQAGNGQFGREARREARRAARKARRAAHRAHRTDRRRGAGPPWPFALIVSLAITVGIVAVAVTLQVVVPVVLQILSALLGRRALANAAEAVREGGDATVEGMRAARDWALGKERSLGTGPGGKTDVAPRRELRVAGEEDPRIRVRESEEVPVESEEDAESQRSRRRAD